MKQQTIAAKAELTVQMVVDRLRDITFADPRDLVSHHIGCCRHCHGVEHKYQWRDVQEQQKALIKYHEDVENGKRKVELPDFSGGTGYSPKLDPHPDCPHCDGHGYGRTIIKDTRHLSQAAAALFAGIKETKEGFEVKMHSQLDAAEKLMKHLGGYKEDNEQKRPELPEALGAFLSQLHEKGAGRMPLAPRASR